MQDMEQCCELYTTLYAISVVSRRIADNLRILSKGFESKADKEVI